MVRRFIVLLLQDLSLVTRNGFLWVLLGVLVAMVLIIRLTPVQVDLGATQFFLDEIEGGSYREYLSERGVAEASFVDDVAALEEAVEDHAGAFGIVMSGAVDDPRFEVFYRGEPSDQTLAVIEAALLAVARERSGTPTPASITVEEQRPGAASIPLNLRSVPMLITFEVLILGFLFVAVMVFQEKQDGVVRAYRVSPGGTFVYVVAKVVLFVALSWLYGVLFVFGTMGIDVDWLRLSALLLVGSALMTLGGLAIAVFFDNISEWFLAGVGVLLLNFVPVVSWAIPAWAPEWVTWLPSYPILFTTRDVLFDTGADGFGQTMVVCVVETAVLLGLCWLAVRRKLMREG